MMPSAGERIQPSARKAPPRECRANQPPGGILLSMMPEKKHYSYTNLADTPKHGEIIESSYLLGDKGPKSTWTRIFEMVVLLATVGGFAYLAVFLFHHSNRHPAREDSPSHPHRPVGASSAALDDAGCVNHPKCKALINDEKAVCCPNTEGDFLDCCF